MSKKDQLELFQADVSWFHIFKELIKTKTWAKMSPAAKALYPTIKAFTNWKDGRAFPSLDTLEEYSGLSRPSVTKALNELESLGFIEATKESGKKTRYKLIERFEVQDQEGRPVASASFDYLPGIINDATMELKNYVAKGMKDSGQLQYIHIDKLTINMAARDVIGTQNNTVDVATLLRGLKDKLDGKETDASRYAAQFDEGVK